MSRIGKRAIKIPAKTEAVFSNGIFSVKGPLGELSMSVPKEIDFSINSEEVFVLIPTSSEVTHSAIWGTYGSHASNMIEGVSKGFEKKLLVEGIGYKVELKGDKLNFNLGFSHPVEVNIPDGIKVSVEKNSIIISGVDKEKVGSFASKIRAIKKPEPYKGKGIRYADEVVKIKQGKKSVT